MSPWPKNPVVRALAFLWGLPMGLVGMLGALAFWALGWGRPRVSDGAVEVLARGPMAAALAQRGWAALTVGWCVAYWSPAAAASKDIHVHEREHVRQFLCWGPLMAVAYPLGLLLWGYAEHPLERAARAAEAR